MIESSFSLTMKAAKVAFFDRNIKVAVDNGRRKALSRAGAIVRGIARRSIKFRKNYGKHAPPNSPPFTHRKSTEFGLKTILFAYDEGNDTVVVGPVGSAGRAPEVLEFGGVANVRLTPRMQKKYGRRTIRASIKARPFMGPALTAFQDDYPDLWKGIIR